MATGEQDVRLRDLLIKATKNAELRAEILKDPVGAGKKNGVVFSKDQLERIKKTAEFVESLSVLRLPPGPIFYPIDPILVRWRTIEIIDVLRYLIFYPAPDIGILREQVLRGRLRAIR